MGYSELSDEEKYSFISPPIKISLEKKYNLNENDANIATNIFRDRYKNVDLYEAEIYPNVINLLKLLKENKIYTAIATYKREYYAIFIL